MDRRFIQLFKILAKEKKYIKSDLLCEQLDIRPRTLREDIRQYKNTIEKEAGCLIESKPNAGYILKVVNEQLYNQFVQKLLQQETNSQYLIPVNQEERIFYIIRFFLSHQDYVKLNELADEIYVSRSTLNADIREVKERLSYFHLQLVSRAGYGLKISGKEKDIRSCIAQYFYHFDSYDENYIENINIQSRFIDQEAFAQVKDILYECIIKHAFKLTDFGFQNLAIHLLIAVSRMKEKTYVEEFFKTPEEISNRKELQIAKDIASRLDSFFHIHMPSSEIHYIAVHLMGKQALQLNDHQLVLEKNTIEMMAEIYQEIQQVYGIDFSKDFDLYAMLSLHLQPLLNRLKYDLKSINPLTEQIKKDSPTAFEMAVLAGKVIQSKIHKDVADSELGYLALHFALALERLNRPSKKNIIIVCASGAGSSQILLYKIKSKFKDYLGEVLVSEAYKLQSLPQENYDFILSTIPLPFKTKIPLIQVQFFLSKQDLITIENALTKNVDGAEDFIRHCFREEFFFNHLQGKTSQEVILEMCQLISQKHPLPTEFFDLVLAREAVSPTEVGNKIAIPHPLHLCMDETFVAIGILDKPIKWEKNMIKFIFMLCIQKDSDEALTIFNEVLSGLILNQAYIQSLEKHPSFHTIRKYIDALSQEKAEQMKESIFQ